MKKIVPINPTEEVKLKMGVAVGKRPGANVRWIEGTEELLGGRVDEVSGEVAVGRCGVAIKRESVVGGSP